MKAASWTLEELTMMLTVREFMTVDPQTIGRDATVEQARQRMCDFNIRHLVVTRDGELEGIVSLRDLDAIQRGCRIQESAIAVEEAMMPVIYRVKATATLDDVAREMAERRIGSAVVVDERDRAIGLFTTVDALRALARLAARS
jgi:acetoin utilization protein AcuB